MLLNVEKSGVVFSSEHNAFLLMWFCWYYICIDSVGVVSEYCNSIMTLTMDYTLAMGPLLLSTLYQGIFHILDNLKDGHIEYNNVSGPI